MTSDRSLQTLLAHPDPRVPDRVRRQPPTPGAIATFDADGTLWAGDVAEDFARWMIERGAWEEAHWRVYEAINREDPAAAAVRMLDFFRDQEAAALQRQVEQFWREQPPRQWLKRPVASLAWAVRQGARTFVVSASPEPVLRPLKQRLPATLLALEVEIDGAGRYTGGPAGIPTTGEGKARRLREACSAPVHLAVGDSGLDCAMLRLSEGLSWAVNPSPELRRAAERKGWLITEES